MFLDKGTVDVCSLTKLQQQWISFFLLDWYECIMIQTMPYDSWLGNISTLPPRSRGRWEGVHIQYAAQQCSQHLFRCPCRGNESVEFLGFTRRSWSSKTNHKSHRTASPRPFLLSLQSVFMLSFGFCPAKKKTHTHNDGRWDNACWKITAVLKIFHVNILHSSVVADAAATVSYTTYRNYLGTNSGSTLSQQNRGKSLRELQRREEVIDKGGGGDGSQKAAAEEKMGGMSTEEWRGSERVTRMGVAPSSVSIGVSMMKASAAKTVI